MILTRIVIGAVLIVVVLALVWADASLSVSPAPAEATPSTATSPALGQTLRLPSVIDYLLTHGAILTGVLAIVLTWGTVEMTRLARGAGHEPLRIWSGIAVAALALSPWIESGWSACSPQTDSGFWLTGPVLGLSVLVGFVLVLARARVEGAIGALASTTWLIVYLGLFGSFLVRLRTDLAGPLGSWAVLYVIAVVKFSDIGAYFTGVLIGRHRVVPTISPKKTAEGYVGGLVLAVVVSVVLAYLLGIISAYTGQPDRGMLLPLGRAVLFGVLMGLTGEVGDLLESLIKRDAQIKDSGSVLPAFGGILDIIDSPLFAAPLAWCLLMWWLG